MDVLIKLHNDINKLRRKIQILENFGGGEILSLFFVREKFVKAK